LLERVCIKAIAMAPQAKLETIATIKYSQGTDKASGGGIEHTCEDRHHSRRDRESCDQSKGRAAGDNEQSFDP